MNNNRVNQLINVLEKEYELYRELNSLAGDKKKVIIDNDIEELGQLLEKDKQLINSLEELETKRNELINQFKEQNNIESKEIKFKQLVDKVSSPWHEKLLSIRKKLVEIIDELHRQNQQNKTLVEQSLKYNNFSVDMIMKFLEPDNGTYNVNEKSRKKGRTKHLIDRKG